MVEFIDKNWENREKNPFIKTKHDLLVLASIVEKEASNFEEKRLVASVFLNRLKKKMYLQSDPTAVYSYTLGDSSKEKDIKANILIRQKSSHNTYRTKGLPPTPICNPSRESIIAVLRPAKSDYLFFIYQEGRGLSLSTNYVEHIRLVNILRRKINQRAVRGVA
jgi:UPF0755 protein